MHIKRFIAAFIIGLLLYGAPPTEAAPQHLFKIASLAPAGSVWVTQFEKFAAEVTEKTDGRVGFRVYPGGVMGDDQAMYRKIRVGQLHGGGFTMTGISSVVPDFRVLAIPFLFNTYEEVDHVKAGLIPLLEERFRDKGLEMVAMTEVGFIYAMSTEPLHTLQDLQQSANWGPAGDPISQAYLQTIGITPVQLTIPDVLSALQSGLVDTVYNSLYGAIVLQWFTKARHVIDVPYGYAYGVFALDQKRYNRLSADDQAAIDEAAARHFPALLAETRKSNAESRKIMQEQGIEFITVDPKTVQALQSSRDETVQQLVPQSLSEEIYERAVQLLEEYRKTVPGQAAD